MIRGIAIALALAAPLVAGASAAGAPAQQTDWTKAIGKTAEGAYFVGNPDAKVRLVEYGSMTCNHCANFHAQAMKPLLANYIASGKLAFEFRNLLRDPADISAALLARCAGSSRFFAASGAMFEQQEVWLGQLRVADRDALTKAVQERDFAGLARIAGLDLLAGKHGVSPAQASVCLKSQAELETILAMTQKANEAYGINSTPSFLINDRLVPVHDWASLKPLIEQALAE